MDESADFLIVGAGISGAAAAYALAPFGRVILLEMESRPGYHSTGRSAALYTPNYGPPVVRAICRASFPFLQNPPEGFSEQPLLTPRGLLLIATPGQEAAFDAALAAAVEKNEIYEISESQASALVPVLKPSAIARAALEAGVCDMDVAAMHQGFLRGARRQGCRIFTDCRVEKLTHDGKDWLVLSTTGRFRAKTVINAAGAWAEHIGICAGLPPIGLVPKRRTAIRINPPADFSLAGMPAVDSAGEHTYFKPDAAMIMASPGDETPLEPQDAQPEDIDVAIIADWLERHTNLDVTRIPHRWAGLRSFVADGLPVAGFDPAAPGFFWLAGQGGYGIMMAAALGQTAASLITSGSLPPPLVAQGITPATIGPGRCRKAAQAS